MKYQYKFCSNCGELFDKTSDLLYVCPKCDFRIFVSPKPAVGAILLNSKSQVLLTKRSYNPGKGKWGLPGGFVDLGENAYQALKREVFEETGLKVNNFKFFGSFSGEYLYKKINYVTYNSIFICRYNDKQKISISDESTEFNFFDISKIPVDLVAPNEAKLALNKLIQSKLH